MENKIRNILQRMALVLVWPWLFRTLLAGYIGITIGPLILVKSKAHAKSQALIRHELIHLFQFFELAALGVALNLISVLWWTPWLLLLILYMPFLYVVFFVVNLCLYRNWNKAYRQIPFEREANAGESDPSYLKERKWLAWVQS